MFIRRMLVSPTQELFKQNIVIQSNFQHKRLAQL